MQSTIPNRNFLTQIRKKIRYLVAPLHILTFLKDQVNNYEGKLFVNIFPFVGNFNTELHKSAERIFKSQELEEPIV